MHVALGSTRQALALSLCCLQEEKGIHGVLREELYFLRGNLITKEEYNQKEVS